MTRVDKHSAAVIQAAEKAIAKISDPKLRAKAIAELKATQKRLTVIDRQLRPDAGRGKKAQDQDLDYDR